jgi:hypothetical protein
MFNGEIKNCLKHVDLQGMPGERRGLFVEATTNP